MTSIPEPSDARDPQAFTGAITFEHVAFSYNPEVPVLQDVTFSVAPGQFVGVVGVTGSGKSTIASLNIAYGRPHATEEEIIAAARLANADEFIVRMPYGYDTPVGERGLTLSGGQRQRIGIAGALIRNAPILILDEPTASLDTESEHLVMEGLERLMKDRTVMMIAHRLNTIRDADMIIVLHDGIVAEHGTHEELLALGRIYAGLSWTRAAAPTDSPASDSTQTMVAGLS